MQPDAAATAASADSQLLAFADSAISAETVRRRASSLAGPGAAAYIAAELHALGFEPAGDSGTFVQHLPVDRIAHRTAAAANARHREDSGPPSAADDTAAQSEDGRAVSVPPPVLFHATGAQGSTSPVFGRDFFVQSISVSSARGPLVWAGVAAPGRRAPGPEAAGRVLAFYLPGKAPDNAWHAALSTAIQGSVDAGAVAVLIVLDPDFSQETVAALASRPNEDAGPMMAVGLRYDAAQRIFRNGLRDLDQLRNGPNRLVPVSGTMIELDAPGGGPKDEGPGNAVAVLPGSDPVLKDTYIVFSAPVDRPGTQASSHATSEARASSRDAEKRDVAASGSTAALLEVASAFAGLPERPERSLIFLGVGGDGAGRLGSQYFAAKPPVPAERIVANISIESLVENATDTIAAIGQHYTSMGPLVQQVVRTHPELHLAVAPDLSPEDDRFFTGDSFSFARIGVPPITFAAAPTWDSSEDVAEVDGRFDADEAGRLARIAQFIFYFGHALASRAERPIWTAEGRAAVQKNE